MVTAVPFTREGRLMAPSGAVMFSESFRRAGWPVDSHYQPVAGYLTEQDIENLQMSAYIAGLYRERPPIGRDGVCVLLFGKTQLHRHTCFLNLSFQYNSFSRQNFFMIFLHIQESRITKSWSRFDWTDWWSSNSARRKWKNLSTTFFVGLFKDLIKNNEIGRWNCFFYKFARSNQTNKPVLPNVLPA